MAFAALIGVGDGRWRAAAATQRWVVTPPCRAPLPRAPATAAALRRHAGPAATIPAAAVPSTTGAATGGPSGRQRRRLAGPSASTRRAGGEPPPDCFDIVWATPPRRLPSGSGFEDGGAADGGGGAGAGASGRSVPPPPRTLVYISGLDGQPLGPAQLSSGALTADYMVASLTHRPNDTTSTWEQLTVSAVAAVEAVMAATGTDRVTLVGESFGALVALRVAAAAPPGVVDTLTLLNSATAVARRSLPAVTVRALSPLLPLLKADLVGGRLFYSAAAMVMWGLLTDRTRLARGDDDGSSPADGGGAPWEAPRGLDVQQVPLSATLHRTRLIRQFVSARWADDAAVLAAVAGVRGGVGLVASGRDRLLPSVAEADRLARVLIGGGVPVWRTVLPESAHACLLEQGVALVNLLKMHGTPAGGPTRPPPPPPRPVPSSAEAVAAATAAVEPPPTTAAAAAGCWRTRGAAARCKVLAPLRLATSPVYLHTDRVRAAAVAARGGGGTGRSSRAGHPRPLLFVGNHTSLGILDLPLLVTHLVATHGLPLRSLAHPIHFEQFSVAIPGWGALLADLGAVVATPRNYVRLLASGQPTLLFPGGAREVATRTDDARYQLHWEEGSFVRAAARHGALIIPVASVGVEDATSIVIDGPGILSAPLGVGAVVRAAIAAAGLDSDNLMPLVAPTPGGERFYFSFGHPIDAAAATAAGDDADALFATVKAAVEGEIGVAMAYRRRDAGRYLRGRLVEGGMDRLLGGGRLHLSARSGEGVVGGVGWDGRRGKGRTCCRIGEVGPGEAAEGC
ncbi:hypothetical protein MMPV_008524 [Pyropia vietnamensis]